MDRHCGRDIDNLLFFAAGGENGAQPVGRRFVLDVADYDDNWRFSLDGIWLLQAKPLGLFCQCIHIALPAGFGVHQGIGAAGKIKFQ
jgi:hypothetical protein